jgi:putative Holliday junction resolvase
MIVMALDYGEKRMGAAVCDALGIAAHALATIERDGQEMERIAELVREREVHRVVLGLPLRLDGTEGKAARRVRGFAKRLRRHLAGVEVVTVDERLTTAEAHRALSAMGAKMRDRRERVDQMAAQIILTRYLQQMREGGIPE